MHSNTKNSQFLILTCLFVHGKNNKSKIFDWFQWQNPQNEEIILFNPPKVNLCTTL